MTLRENRRFSHKLPLQKSWHILTRLQAHYKYQHIHKSTPFFFSHEEHYQFQERIFYFHWSQLIQEPVLEEKNWISFNKKYIPHLFETNFLMGGRYWNWIEVVTITKGVSNFFLNILNADHGKLLC